MTKKPNIGNQIVRNEYLYVKKLIIIESALSGLCNEGEVIYCTAFSVKSICPYTDK